MWIFIPRRVYGRDQLRLLSLAVNKYVPCIHHYQIFWECVVFCSFFNESVDCTCIILYIEVQASHLLVKHAGSRRPSSWREEKITRTKEEAINILKGYRQQIVNKEKTFEELATQFSDCSSAKRGGDLGPFGKGQMQRAFEVAAFGLKVSFHFLICLHSKQELDSCGAGQGTSYHWPFCPTSLLMYSSVYAWSMKTHKPQLA